MSETIASVRDPRLDVRGTASARPTDADRGIAAPAIAGAAGVPRAGAPATRRGGALLSEELRTGGFGDQVGDPWKTLAQIVQAGGLDTRIRATSRRWNVDPMAIVGVIAFEAVVNPRVTSMRASGLGKIHFREHFIPFGEGEPLAKQLEEFGYLPRRTMEERQKALMNNQTALDYIGAALHAFAVIAATWGYSIRSNPGVLGFAYNSMKLDTWDRRLSTKERQPLRAGEAGQWIENNLARLREIYPDKAWREVDPGAMDPAIRECDRRLSEKRW